jgi:hypothetical protein
MKYKQFMKSLFIIAIILGALVNISAQITITLPGFKKIKKPKIEQSQNDSTIESDQSNQKNSSNGDNQKEVESFTPERGWLINSNNYDHLLYAVSPQAREKWLTSSNALDYKNCLASAFDKLAAAAATKLPLFLPNTKAYAQHNPLEERLMRSKISDLADHKIFYIGVQEPSWLIDKNELGIPKNRYKHGMVWVRYTPNDHAYCRVYYINVIQDYAGGGTYGASYATFIEDQLVGCPTSAAK